MNKGCLISAGVFLGLLVLCCGGGSFFLYQNIGPGLLVAIQLDVDEYRKKHPEISVAPTNEAWTTALTDRTNGLPNQKNWESLAQLGKGRLIDIPYRNPLRFVPRPDGSVMVVSNGKDGKPDTADDETSEAALAKFGGRK